VNEDVVKEFKLMGHNRVTPETDHHIRNVNSLLIFSFRESRKKLAQECDAYTADFHSSPVDISKDVMCIASKLLQDDICNRNVSRNDDEEQKEVMDLFIRGQHALATTQRITKYKNEVFKWRVEAREEDQWFDEEREDQELGNLSESEDEGMWVIDGVDNEEY
jgi:hypothetical protein